MSDSAASIATSINQITAALAAISGLAFWRGSAGGELLHSMGKISRVSLVVPLTPRVRRLQVYHRIRLGLFFFFLCCLGRCLYSLACALRRGSLLFGDAPADPGLALILAESTRILSTECLWLCFCSFCFMGIEWILDGVCQYSDLEASLQMMGAGACVERADTQVFRLEQFDDVLTLWQARIRYCVECHGAAGLEGILEKLGDANVDWSDYAAAVSSFRLINIHRLTEVAKKPNELPAWMKSVPTTK